MGPLDGLVRYMVRVSFVFYIYIYIATYDINHHLLEPPMGSLEAGVPLGSPGVPLGSLEPRWCPWSFPEILEVSLGSL